MSKSAHSSHAVTNSVQHTPVQPWRGTCAPHGTPSCTGWKAHPTSALGNKTVHRSIIKDIPVVLIEGSGGFADVLAEACKLDIENLTEETVKQLLTNCLIVSRTNDELHRWSEQVKDCARHKNLLSVFKLDPTDTFKDLDFAILKAVLNASYYEDQPEKMLKLLLEWNRSDIARSLILNDDSDLSKAVIAECFFTALEQKKAGFCKIFLEFGVDIEKFLTIGRLKSLYRSSSKETILYEQLSKIGFEKFTLIHIGKIMRQFMDSAYVNIYSGKPNKYCAVVDLTSRDVEFPENASLDDPYREIFQWAILTGCCDIARYIWEYMSESIPAAIVATKILKRQALKTSDHDRKSALQTYAAEFEKLTVGVLGRCFEKSPKDTTKLLVRTLKKWGGYTCLDIAVQANDTLLVSNIAVQHHFDQVWMGRCKNDTQRFVSQPLVSGADIESQVNKDPPVSRKEDKRKNATVLQDSKQINWSYFAPRVTFWSNVILFLVYVSLFTCVLLNSFTEVVSVMECILIFWLSTFLLEEVREIVGENTRRLKDKIIIHYYRNLWNIMDMLSFLLFYLGVILRWNPYLDTAFGLYCICFMIQCVSRIAHIFDVHQFIGPKIIMMGKLLKDLLFFLLFLVILILVYGVVSQALLYPNETNIADIVVGIIYKPYWNIYGELFLDEINYNPNTGDFKCSSDIANDLPRCPQKNAVVPILSAVYLFFVNVLLLNLLIGMFSYTFDKVERQGNEIWRLQRYWLITKYYHKPYLPPPLIVASYIWQLCKIMKSKFCATADSKLESAFKKHLKPEEQRRLNRWERWHAEAFLEEKRRTDKFKPENQLLDINNRFESLMSRVEKLQGSLGKSNALFMERFERQMSTVGSIQDSFERSNALVMERLGNLESLNGQDVVRPGPSA